jgi:hypothetical protein
MWTAGSWNAALTVFTGIFVAATPTIEGYTTWTGAVAAGSEPGSYIWDGVWS